MLVTSAIVLAQMDLPRTEPSWLGLTTPTLAIAVTACVVVGWLWHVCVLGMRQEQRKRELEHLERLRALETGHGLTQDKGVSSGVSIAVGAPAAVFGIAFVASLANQSAVPFVWPMAGAVGITAVICGTILAYRQPVPGRSDVTMTTRSEKQPICDPDTFDVAGRRG